MIAAKQANTDKKNYTGPLLIFVFISIVIFSIYFLPSEKSESVPLENNKTDSVQNTALPQKNSDTLALPIARSDDELKRKPLPIEENIINKNKEEDVNSSPTTITFGYLQIKCTPWAEVYIDSQKIDTTPIKTPLRLSSGDYLLELRHPEYPAYTDTISISEKDVLKLNIDLNMFAGFLKCNVFPWGDIYIDNIYKGQTPLKRALILKPGLHQLEIRNPELKTYFSEIVVTQSETLSIAINLKNE